VHGGKWAASLDFAYWEKPLVELDGLMMGIVGVGMIGGAVGRIAQAFGMKVMAYSRSARDLAGVKFVDLETLFREADVVSLHCPLTDQTRGLVNAERLGWMKRSALLINTSRGALVDERALAAALNEERIAGAGLDVLSAEPPKAENPLLSAKNCVITPHIAWGTRAARMRLMNEAVQNLRAFVAGQPRNVVQ
jgi:glycerate dehydrogenase